MLQANSAYAVCANRNTAAPAYFAVLTAPDHRGFVWVRLIAWTVDGVTFIAEHGQTSVMCISSRGLHPINAAAKRLLATWKPPPASGSAA